MMDWKGLEQDLEGCSLIWNAPMKEYTTFRAGGTAALLLEPDSPEQLCRAVQASRRRGVPYLIMGNGSNLLVQDGGYDGLVIRLGSGLGQIRRIGNCLEAGAGASLIGLSRRALHEGLMGLEWAGGIPGSVGGAVAMNAGAYGGEIKNLLQSVTVLEGDTAKTLSPRPEDMGYRYSRFSQPEYVVLSALFRLEPDDGGAMARQEEYSRRRQEKQTLQYPSAGSTFKRPEGHYAGALIEQAGLKGMRVGGAEVSTLHAGFIINRGGAAAADIVELIGLIQRRVKEHCGVELEPEIKIVGREA